MASLSILIRQHGTRVRFVDVGHYRWSAWQHPSRRGSIVLLRTALAYVSICFLSLAIGPLTSVRANTFLYVSLDGENRIAIYAIDPVSGELSESGETALPSPAGALSVSPNGQLLFASLRSAGQLASFRIHADHGSLALLSTVPGGEDPAFVATDRTGRFLLTAYYAAGKVTVHAIGQDGALSQTPLQTVHTAEKAHAILTDPSNHFAFVPHTGPNAIYCFRFDDTRGRLTPTEPDRVDTGTRTGPRQLVFHPRGDVVYFDYEQGSALAAYNLDSTTGGIRFAEQVSTLPARYDQENTNARVDITPDGRFMYVANRGHDSLAMFAVDAHTCKVTPLGQEPTEATPRGFAVDPSSRFLYAAGQSTGKLAAFHIDHDSGRLQRFATYPVGERPWWVLAVEPGTADQAMSDDDDAAQRLAERFPQQVRVLLQKYCLDCHDAENHEGKLDLSRFSSVATIAQEYTLWRTVLERLESEEMPPAEAVAQPNREERRAAVEWIAALHHLEAKRHAGDPGQVLRGD